VVGVAVREEDRVGLDLVGRRRRLRVPGQERVDEDARALVLEQERRMAEPGDLPQWSLL
jgi:hypothetical protein